MKVHYFQRYHKGEDVATANTMLLVSRLYTYSSNKFFQFLKDQFFSDIDFEPELSFILQDSGTESVPDATISQPSFKLVIETKLTDWFYKEQLIKHFGKFKNEEYKALITLSTDFMEPKKKSMIDQAISEYNEKHQTNIIHVNTTFMTLAQGIQDVITDHDYEMQDVLDDYLDYCHNDKLIMASDAWKTMRMQLAGTTFDFNISENVYYDNINRGFRSHDYLGLYKQKSIKAIGKISAIITATLDEENLQYECERGELTEQRKQIICKAIKDGKKYGYEFNTQRYFFVEKFYETDFKKVTPRAPMGSRIFDLTEILGISQLPSTKEIADMLKEKTWG